MKEKQWDITDMEAMKQAASEALSGLPEITTVLALCGDLGTGKTTFTQIVASNLGIKESITSPTFVLMKRYQTDDAKFQSLIHIDAYRLESSEELAVLGFKNWLQEENTLIVVEWADKVADLLPSSVVRLDFNLNDRQRTLTHHES